MPYTVWSNDILIGHSDLGFVECLPKHKCGWFHATPEGEPIISVLNEPRRLMLHYHDCEDRDKLEADLQACHERIMAIPLELRDADGNALAIEDIGIMDMEITRQYGELAQTEFAIADSSVDEMVAADIATIEEWDMSEYGIVDEMELEPGVWTEEDSEKEWPRYQMLVCFEGHDAAMQELSLEAL